MADDDRIRFDLADADLLTLIAVAEKIAQEHFDGHLTMMRFTTHWKCGFGTPILTSMAGNDQVQELTDFPTLHSALVHLLVTRPEFRP